MRKLLYVGLLSHICYIALMRYTPDYQVIKEKQLVLDLKDLLEWSHFSRGVLENFTFRSEIKESIMGRRAYIFGIIFQSYDRFFRKLLLFLAKNKKVFIEILSMLMGFLATLLESYNVTQGSIDFHV